MLHQSTNPALILIGQPAAIKRQRPAFLYVCKPHEDMDMKGHITVEAVH